MQVPPSVEAQSSRPPIKLSPKAQQYLCCPICKRRIELRAEQACCLNPECGAVYPIVNGIPVLINERTSVFLIRDFVDQRNTYFSTSGSAETIAKRFIPTITRNVTSRRNFEKFSRLLFENSNSPLVLVIGGSITGQGMEPLLSHPTIQLVATDVSHGPQTQLICDAHDIPFETGVFDGVIVQAVLEHVVDPGRCMIEVSRVLKSGGLIYAETPFIQQVHGGRYDFTRFTHLGHRRLFREYDEIESGAVCGPGTALAWSYQYFLLSFSESKVIRKLIRLFARLTSFYLKYFDDYLIEKAGTFDAASGFYFVGRKNDRLLPDRELLTLYRGLM